MAERNGWDKALKGIGTPWDPAWRTGEGLERERPGEAEGEGRKEGEEDERKESGSRRKERKARGRRRE